ncbi:MAG: glycosyltransferase 87 family protein [Tepidisphaeraceae bacterium]
MPNSFSWVRFIAGTLPGLALLALLCTRCGYNDDPRIYYECSGLVLGRAVTAGWLDAARQNTQLPAIEGRVVFDRQLPYRDFVFEYPPLSLVFFILPRLLADSVLDYYRWIQLEMSLAAVGLGWCLWSLARRLGGDLGRQPLAAGLAWSAFISIIGPTLVRRYDVLPTLAAAGALLAILSRRSLLCGILLGLGAALKLWPAVLGPLFVVALILRHDAAGIVRLIVGAMVLPVLSHAVLIPELGSRVFAYLNFQQTRGIEIESLWASLILLVSQLRGLGVWTAIESGAVHLRTSGWADLAVPISYVSFGFLYGVAMLAAWSGSRRTPIDSIERDVRLTSAYVASITVMLVTTKLLSMQFMIWIFPAVMVLPGRPGRTLLLLYLLALALTVAAFKYMVYFNLTPLWPHTILLIGRNAILLAIAVIAINRSLRSPTYHDDGLAIAPTHEPSRTHSHRPQPTPAAR